METRARLSVWTREWAVAFGKAALILFGLGLATAVIEPTLPYIERVCHVAAAWAGYAVDVVAAGPPTIGHP